MGDKDKPFNFDDFKLGVFCEDAIKELPIFDNSTLFAMDSVNVRESTKAEPIDAERLTAGSYSFNLDNASIDKALSDLLFGTDMQSQNDTAIRSCVLIQSGDDYINRPKSLKYPNKRRKMRIWKKWKNRYGVRPAKQLVIPRAKISTRMEFKDGLPFCRMQITAEEFSK